MVRFQHREENVLIDGPPPSVIYPAYRGKAAIVQGFAYFGVAGTTLLKIFVDMVSKR